MFSNEELNFAKLTIEANLKAANKLGNKTRLLKMDKKKKRKNDLAKFKNTTIIFNHDMAEKKREKARKIQKKCKRNYFQNCLQ